MEVMVGFRKETGPSFIQGLEGNKLGNISKDITLIVNTAQQDCWSFYPQTGGTTGVHNGSFPSQQSG